MTFYCSRINLSPTDPPRLLKTTADWPTVFKKKQPESIFGASSLELYRKLVQPAGLRGFFTMHSSIRPNQFVVIQLPSDQTRIVKLVPNTYDRLLASLEYGERTILTFDEQDYPIRQNW